MKLNELFSHTEKRIDGPSHDELVYESEIICEIAYHGNIGIMELSAFMNKANEQQKKQLNDLIKQKDIDGVWNLVFKVTGMKIMR